MATMEDDYVPIEVDSNRDEEVAEIDSMPVQKKTATVQAGTYKSVVDGKPFKCQRKLTSNVWEHYEFLQPSKDDIKYENSFGPWMKVELKAISLVFVAYEEKLDALRKTTKLASPLMEVKRGVEVEGLGDAMEKTREEIILRGKGIPLSDPKWGKYISKRRCPFYGKRSL
ncbi:hypothetical protein Cgig2_010308 [Carnegiea gigantea]|uniref:Uncharacterized protein n=1 Tax=Carnegiea gigantea TaxID=171969 RepID=A0A9Q1KJ79_9CARY|nr:hypothetical protein Cgig2_010308 [Carnegiea gigantea]